MALLPEGSLVPLPLLEGALAPLPRSSLETLLPEGSTGLLPEGPLLLLKGSLLGPLLLPEGPLLLLEGSLLCPLLLPEGPLLPLAGSLRLPPDSPLRNARRCAPCACDAARCASPRGRSPAKRGGHPIAP